MRIRRILTHPIVAMLAVVVVCRFGVPRWDLPGAKWYRPRMDKEFYPFSSFPMYADPGPEPSEYVIVCDGNDQPFSIQQRTGDTSAKVKKKYIAARNRLADKAGIENAGDAPPELCAEAWQQVVEGLRRTAAKRKRDLPPVVRLKLVRLYQEDGRFREEIGLIGDAK